MIHFNKYSIDLSPFLIILVAFGRWPFGADEQIDDKFSTEKSEAKQNSEKSKVWQLSGRI